MGGMNNMLKQVQKMQKEMEKVQDEMKERTVEATSGGGAVKVTASGKKEILDIIIDPSAVNPDDVEMLQDMIIAAVNEALRKADEMMTSEMGKITGGLNIPGMPGL